MQNTTTENTGLKIDILHVHKKEIIPIYCYGYDNENKQYLFGVTPFGIPYVNSTNIIDFYSFYDKMNTFKMCRPKILLILFTLCLTASCRKAQDHSSGNDAGDYLDSFHNKNPSL